MRQLLPGLLFASLWASASVATKFGVHAAEPLVLANVRFFLAGGAMLVFAHLIRPAKNQLPKGSEWVQLTVFSLMNTTIYLGAYVIALQQVSAGIGSLSVATSPLFISLISAIWMKRKMKMLEITGLILGLTGVSIASYPLLKHSYATVEGLLILLGGMVSVSLATVYYAKVKWNLTNVVINGWQVMLGGIMLLPFTLFSTDLSTLRLKTEFWLSVMWLVLPVSIVALQLWFYLVKKDAVRASLWLFLCPIFGFVYARILLNEPITLYTWVGTGLVIIGLYIAQKEKLKGAK